MYEGEEICACPMESSKVAIPTCRIRSHSKLHLAIAPCDQHERPDAVEPSMQLASIDHSTQVLITVWQYYGTSLDLHLHKIEQVHATSLSLHIHTAMWVYRRCGSLRTCITSFFMSPSSRFLQDPELGSSWSSWFGKLT